MWGREAVEEERVRRRLGRGRGAGVGKEGVVGKYCSQSDSSSDADPSGFKAEVFRERSFCSSEIYQTFLSPRCKQTWPYQLGTFSPSGLSFPSFPFYLINRKLRKEGSARAERKSLSIPYIEQGGPKEGAASGSRSNPTHNIILNKNGESGGHRKNHNWGILIFTFGTVRVRIFQNQQIPIT